MSIRTVRLIRRHVKGGAGYWYDEDWLPWVCGGFLAEVCKVNRNKPLWLTISSEPPEHEEYAILQRVGFHPQTCSWRTDYKINGEEHGYPAPLYPMMGRALQMIAGREESYVWVEQEE